MFNMSVSSALVLRTVSHLHGLYEYVHFHTGHHSIRSITPFIKNIRNGSVVPYFVPQAFQDVKSVTGISYRMSCTYAAYFEIFIKPGIHPSSNRGNCIAIGFSEADFPSEGLVCSKFRNHHITFHSQGAFGTHMDIMGMMECY